MVVELVYLDWTLCPQSLVVKATKNVVVKTAKGLNHDGSVVVENLPPIPYN